MCIAEDAKPWGLQHARKTRGEGDFGMRIRAEAVDLREKKEVPSDAADFKSL